MRPTTTREDVALDTAMTSLRGYSGRLAHSPHPSSALPGTQLLHAGESYELCLTTQWERRGATPEPWRLYAVLRATNPAPHSAFLRFSDERAAVRCAVPPNDEARSHTAEAGRKRCHAHTICPLAPGALPQICCSSPERFLQLNRHRILEAKPIKGTRARSADPVEDHARVIELRGARGQAEAEAAVGRAEMDTERGRANSSCFRSGFERSMGLPGRCRSCASAVGCGASWPSPSSHAFQARGPARVRGGRLANPFVFPLPPAQIVRKIRAKTS